MDQRTDLMKLMNLVGLTHNFSNHDNSNNNHNHNNQNNNFNAGPSGTRIGSGDNMTGLSTPSSGQFLFPQETAQDLIEEYLSTMCTIRTPTTIILLTLYIPMFLFSLVGNTLVIYLFFRSSQMRRLKSLFLVNLALADEAVTVVCVPLLVAQTVFRLWIYGEFMCKLTGYIQDMTVTCSIFTLTALSIDHYMTVRCPQRDKRMYGKRQTAILLVAIWVVSAIFVSPMLYVRQVKSTHFDQLKISAHYCVESWSSDSARHAYSVFLLLVTYIAPIMVIVGSYALVGRTLCISRRKARQLAAAAPLTSRKRFALPGAGTEGLANGGGGGDSKRGAWTTAGIAEHGDGGYTVGLAVGFTATKADNGENNGGRSGGGGSSGPTGGGSSNKGGGSGEMTEDAPVACSIRKNNGQCRHIAYPSALATSTSVPCINPVRSCSLAVLMSGRRAIIRLLIIIVTVFAVCWLPYHVLSITADIFQDANHSRLLPFAVWLGHAHSAANPVIYWFFNQTFRHCANNVWLCNLLRRGRHDSRSSQYV